MKFFGDANFYNGNFHCEELGDEAIQFLRID